MHTFNFFKKIFPNLFRGLLGGLLAGLLMGNPSASDNKTIRPATDKVPGQTQKLTTSVDFNATLVNRDNKVLEGHEVSIYDITDGRVFVASAESDSNGLASFTGLKTDRSYSVSIDGETTAYTFRNGGSAKMGRTFILDKVSSSDAKTLVSDKLANVRANNADGEVMANVKISLYNDGQEIASAETDGNGVVAFSGLQDGVYYVIYVNGEEYNNFVRTGETADVYLADVSPANTGDESKEDEAAAYDKGLSGETENNKTFTFTARAINEDLTLLPDQSFEIVDTTKGRVTVSTATSNSDGEASFTGLKADRSYTVLVNGEETGYTFRSGDGATIVHNFEVKSSYGNNIKLQTVSSTVNVTNEDSLPLAGKAVTLSRDGKVISSAITDENGRASLENLVEGTIYNVAVDGVNYPFFIVRGGSDVTVAVN